MKPSNVRSRLGMAGAVLLVVGAAFISYSLAMQSGTERLRSAAESRLDMMTAQIDGQLSRFDYLPALLQSSDDVLNFLESPDDLLLRDRVNGYLKSINSAAGATNLYVLDRAGRGLAAADWDKPGTPVGGDFAFRPYMQDALLQGSGRFYGEGVSSGRAGYYFSHSLYKDTRLLGVSAVKADLEGMALEWRKLPGAVLLTDANGVVILSSRAEWTFRPLTELPQAVNQEILRTRPYGNAELLPLAWREIERLSDDVQVVDLAGNTFLASARLMGQTGWRLIALDEFAPIGAAARRSAIMAALMSAVLVLLGVVFSLRHRVVRQKLASQDALQKAHDGLESKVLERTSELQAANRMLSAEIDARTAVEGDLRVAQQEVIRSSQMAAFGQMSAGMVHELNQPLGALRTLSDNACVLLDAKRIDDARGNMQRIAMIVDRLGRLTYQLKSFAHQSNVPRVSVCVQQVINSAQFLVSSRLRECGVEVQVHAEPADLQVLADEARLEQVMVNLMGNAIDAMDACPRRQLIVEAGCVGGRIAITFTDSGPGIRADLLPDLFKPFITSKPAGAGLGLGLAISAQIINELGGDLLAHNLATGGACFIVKLPPQSIEGKDSEQ